MLNYILFSKKFALFSSNYNLLLVFVYIYSEAMKAQAMKTAQDAYTNQQSRLNMFAGDQQNVPRSATEMKEHKQPSIFNGTLKSYQMKGMNWLANLYYFVSMI